MTVSNNLPFVSRLRNLWNAPRVRSPCTVSQPFALITNSTSSANPKSFTASPRMTIYPSPSSINYRYYPAGSTGERRKRSHVCRPYSLAFTVPKTCILGYNNVRFDDEVTRNVFYRNFYDPTPGAGSMITRAGIYWMLCVPVMPCARKE